MTFTPSTDPTGTGPMRGPRPDHLFVVADHTPGIHRTDSDDLLWWLPSLGPTSSWLAYFLARHAAHQEHTRWSIDVLARTVGLAGNHSKLWASLERLDRFDAATFAATDTLMIRLWLPALSARHIDRLPAPLAAAYQPGE